MDSVDSIKFLGQLAQEMQSQAQQVLEWQSKLQQNEDNQEWQKLEALLASAYTFIFSTDEHLLVTSVQGPMTECLGWAEPEFVGREVREFVDPTYYLADDVLKEVSEGSVTRISVPFLTRSGTRFWCQISLVPSLDTNGLLTGFQGIACGVQEIQNQSEEFRLENARLHDHLESVRADQQQKQEELSNSQLNLEFWSRLRSELRSIILGRMRLLFSQAEQGAAPKTLYGLAFGVDFLESLLQLEVKPESWREVESFHPIQVAEHCRGLFTSDTLSLEFQGEPSGEFSGPLRLWQAFLLELFHWNESLSNRSSLQVALSQESQTLKLTAAAILSAEVSVDDSYQQSLKHFARVRRLCEACRAELSIRKENSKSELLLSLTLAASSAVDKSLASAAPATPLPANHYSILVAEDDEIAKRVVVTLLQKLGHQVQSVSGGLDVLELLATQDFDVLLLDLEMPDLDGISTARQVLSRFDPPPYLIALTAGNSASVRRQVMEVGMQDFLSKPLSSDDLNDALSQVHVHKMSRDPQT
jgi:PAS domain S-box-containing protein